MFCATAQKGHTVNTGALSYGLGGMTTLLTGPDALFGNFSCIGARQKSGVMVSSNNRFLLSELKSISVGGYYQLNASHFGLQLSSYGFESYREQTASLSYARRLSSSMAISGSLGWYQLDLAEYGKRQKITYNLGFSADLSSTFSYGFLISNLERSSLDDTSVLVSSLQVGLRYAVSAKVDSYLEVSKELEEKLSLRVGLNYELHPKFDLRLGFDVATGNSGGGFTYKLSKKLHIDGAVQYNGLLGLSPSITIKYLNSQTGN